MANYLLAALMNKIFFRLSGSAAVKSKNVCLHLVDSHTTLTTTGVVQLFTYPHPQKQTFIPFFEKVPPKLLLGSSGRKSSKWKN